MKMGETPRGPDKKPGAKNNQNYHPHGNTSIYDAAVRLTQWFSNNIPLLEGHGNFGSISGDGAAAERYTELRLSAFARDFLLRDVDRSAVDMVPNYDATEEEPTVLPARVPLLLMNGSEGIGAMGYAMDIPPNNPHGVCQAVLRLLDDPSSTDGKIASELCPDPPTGGIICSMSAAKAAYESGRGSTKYRARVRHENLRGGRQAVVIDQVPYGTSVGRLIESILEKSRPSKDFPNPPIMEVHDVRNESAAGEVRVVIELKTDADPGVVENKLYKHTLCEQTMKIILIATERSTFQEYTVGGLLRSWVGFRGETIRRVAAHEARRCEERMHVIEGLLKALTLIRQIIEAVGRRKTAADAREALMAEPFRLTDMQASAVLEMRISRLVGLERGKLETEAAGLDVELRRNRRILSDSDAVREEIEKDQREAMEALKAREPRRALAAEIETGLEREDVMADERWLLTLSNKKYIKRCAHEFKSQKRGGKGVGTGKAKEGDFVERAFHANSKDHLLCFTDQGRVFDLKVWQVEECSLGSLGRPTSGYLKLRPGEAVASVLCATNAQFEDDSSYLLFATRRGIVKRTPMSEFRNIRETGIIAVKFRDGDGLVGARLAPGSEGTDIFLATSGGVAIRFQASEVSEAGRDTMGVKGVDLAKGDEVVSFELVDAEQCYVLSVSSDGLGKKTLLHNPVQVKRKGEDGTEGLFSEDRGFPRQSRGGKGRICMSLRPGARLARALVAYDGEDLVVLSSRKAIRTSTDEVKELLRTTQGVKVIDLAEGEEVADAAVLQSDVEGEENS